MTDEQFVAWLASDDCIRMVLVECVANIDGDETTLYLSSKPYVTGSADTPANTAYEACVLEAGTSSEQLSLNGEASISFGDIEIDNTEGDRDGWLDYVWSNRAVSVYMGDPRWPREDFRKVFEGIVGDVDPRDRTVLNLRLLDKLARLNGPVSENALGGATPNKGRLIPLCLGECFNVQPLLTNQATLEYQVHDGAVEDIIEVRSNGAVPVAITKNVAAGKFTLDDSPYGTITASVQGDKPASYSNDAASLVQRLVTGYGPTTTRFTEDDLDEDSLADFEAANPQPMGLTTSDRANVLSCAQQLAGSVGAQVVCTTLGLLRLVQLTLPPPGVAVEVTAADMVERSLKIAERTPVKAAVKLGYCKNWTVQESLAAGLPPESSDLFRQEWLTVTAKDTAVAAAYKLGAEPLQEDTLLLVEADATAEADRRLDLWKTPRHVYQATFYAHMLLTELGDAITITHDRFGLSAGKTGMAVRISRQLLAGRVTIGVLA